MLSPMLTIFLIAVMLAANVSGQNGLLGPPNRPGDLKNPGVLNNYLKALNEYQDALSRPRFGRSSSKRFSFNEFTNNLPERIE